jgi:hypothetical protein
MKAETRPKPSNATWLDAANVEGECDHPLKKVEVAWYEQAASRSVSRRGPLP